MIKKTVFRRLTLFLLSLVLLSNTVVDADTATEENSLPPLPYAAALLKNFSGLGEDEKQEENDDIFGEEYDEEKEEVGDKEEELKSLGLTVAALTPYEKHLAVLQTLSHMPEAHTCTLNDQFISDLNLYTYNTKYPDFNVLSMLYRGHTTVGKVALAHQLANPTTDTKILQQRQEQIKWLIAHPKALQELNTFFAHLATQEDTLLALLNPQNKLYSKEAREIIFGDNTPLEKYAAPMSTIMHLPAPTSWKLELQRLWLDLGPMQKLLPLGLGSALYYLFFKWYMKVVMYFTTDQSSAARKDKAARVLKELTTFFKFYAGALIVIGGSIQFATKSKEFYHNLQEKRKLVAYMRTRLADLQGFWQKLEGIQSLGKESSELQTILPSLPAALQHLAPGSPLQELIASLRHPVFKSSRYFFSRMGIMFQTLAKLAIAGPLFSRLLYDLGKIEAVVSVANYVKEHANTPATVCFPRYLQHDTPQIRLRQLWHPLVGAHKAVTSSVILGTQGSAEDPTHNGHQNMVVTGPNTGGKSTFVRSVAINLLLAQTLGIAAAEKMSFTPFSLFNSSLKATDKIGEGQSLFYAELERGNNLVKSVSNMTRGQFAFNALDEVFSGTAPKQGEAGSFALTQILGTQPHAVTLVATHFPAMTSLPKHTNNSFANYRVMADKHPDGTVTLPYKLEHGRSMQSIVLDLLRRDGFDPELVKRAQQFMLDRHPNYDKL